MEITTLCAVVVTDGLRGLNALCVEKQEVLIDCLNRLTSEASLRIVPSRSQFFQYESVSLCCEVLENSGWRVKRNTSKTIKENCPSWNGINGSHCFISDLYPSDTGIYWCESGSGECSDGINITVTGGSVILESPIHPVNEGESVTLRCRMRSSSDLITKFYKDELLVGSTPTGNMTIHSVSKSDEGLYKCNISGVGQSADSRLNVRGLPEPPYASPALILLPVVGIYVLLLSVMLLCLCGACKDQMDLTVVLYTEVATTRECKGGALKRKSFSFSSVAVYTAVRCTPKPVLTYKPCS